MQLASQCSSDIDHFEKCIDTVNCENFHECASATFETKRSTALFVMLQKWLCDFKFDKYMISGNPDTDLSMTQNMQQVQSASSTKRRANNLTAIENHLSNNIQMERNIIFHPKFAIGQTSHYAINGKRNDRAFWTDPIDRNNRNVWNKNLAIRRNGSTTPVHSQLISGNKHCIKSHECDRCTLNEHHLPRTMLTTHTFTTTIDQNIGSTNHSTSNNTRNYSNSNDNDKQNANKLNATAHRLTSSTSSASSSAASSVSGSTSASTQIEPSLKIVHRSPLTVVHRANFVQIFIKYLLILNCLLCFAAGNLTARNIGNDLSSKHNNTSTEMGGSITTPLNSSPANNRNGQPSTTLSPLNLHSFITNNRTQQFQSPTFPNPDSERAKLFLQHAAAAQEALTSDGGYISDEPANPFARMPNAGDDSSEEFSRCASCQFREQLKAQNLASIKMHILARLSMTHPPNITGRPHISEQILQTFYQNNDFRYIRIRNGSTTYDLNEMQGDDPNASTATVENGGQHQHQHHQHHHLHEYHRNGGTGSSSGTGIGGSSAATAEQHHHHQSSYHHHNRHTRIDNEYNEEYDYNDRGGIVYNMDYYDEPRSSTRLHYDDIPPYDNVEETDEAFYSTTEFIYSFPKLSKARHRGDILEFTIKNNNHLSVSGATFNLYVRGEDWIGENESNIWMRNGGGGGGSSNVKSNAGGSGGNMHTDDTVTSATTIPATVRDEHHQHATFSDSFHKQHGNNKNVNNNHISISINRFVHRHQQQQNINDQDQSKKSGQSMQQQQQPSQQQQQRYTRIDSNFVGEIPKGAGEWIQFNITAMVSEWIQQQQQKHQSVNTQSADIVQEVVIKTLEPWMRQLLVLDTNSKNRPYIEIQTRDMRKHRTKRHLAKDCRENDRQSRCCRYPLRVDFRKFGWDWIIAPDIYEAYYCAGECPIGFLPKHPHTYIYSLSSSFSTCCSPRKLSPLSLLYFDDNKNVIHSIIPNMAVEKCGCS